MSASGRMNSREHPQSRPNTAVPPGSGWRTTCESLGETTMTLRLLAHRLTGIISLFFSGWSYSRWDPPYPGDGI